MNKDRTRPVQIMDFRGTYKGGGGPDKTILLSAHIHDKAKVHVLVAYLRDPRDSIFEIGDRARKLGLDYIEFNDRHLLDLKCLRLLHSATKSRNIEVLHAHDDKTMLYAWLLKLLNPKLRIVYTCHLLLEYGRQDFYNLRAYLLYLLRQSVAYHITKRFLKPIMAVSEATRKQLLQQGFKNGQVVVLHNGIDIDTWMRKNGHPILRSELGLRSDELLVGTVARIDQQKDFPTFFAVAKTVKSRVPNCRFVIVGDGKEDELSKTKSLAKDLGLAEYLHFTGHRNDLLDIYASLDLFLMTSVAEGLPNTVLESMAMAVPVVSTSVAGVPELVLDGITGYLCPIGNTDALSNRVVDLLINRNLRQSFSDASRERIIQNFSFRDRVRKLEELYQYYAQAR
ncbi:MAG: glycosyltransferase family 4 protein [Acidobacteria bacterium]|nr:glycosyltransferase family 4 protein [Acidobacteriota bacterium]